MLLLSTSVNPAVCNPTDNNPPSLPPPDQVITPFSVAQSKEVTVHLPPTRLAEKDDAKMASRLIDQCCQNHRRAHFGILPPEVTKLCIYSTGETFHPYFLIFVNCFFSCVSVVSEALAYVQLQDMLTNSSASGSHAIQHVLTALGNVAMHGQSTDQGDREDMLPLLQLLKDFVTMVRPSLPPQYLCSQKAMADM